jgi:hypothetical protein
MFPFGSNVAVCPILAALMEPVAAKVLLAGSYSSALERKLPSSSWPPAMSTLPSGNKVAVCHLLPDVIVETKVPLAGSYNSAPKPEYSPATNTFPFGNNVAVWLSLSTFIEPVAVNKPGGGATVTTTCAVTESPAGLVTVRVYVVLACSPPVFAPTPLLMLPIPLLMVPVPSVKIAVRVALVPALIVGGLAVKLTMVGNGTTVTSTCAVTESRFGFHTVKV